jgi:L-threonylcarbamoyladenylate synthase
MGVVCKVDQQHPSEEAITRGVSVLEKGGVLVVPTDSVYGLACAATPNNPAHQRIFQIKRRDPSQTLPIFVADVNDLDTLAKGVPAWARSLAKHFWPGALTLVVSASEALAPEYLAPTGTVALRCPDSALVRELTRRVGPLAQTSANTHGAPAAVSGETIEPAIAAAADLVMDAGPAPEGVASTIVDCTGKAPVLLREGTIRQRDVLAALSA